MKKASKKKSILKGIIDFGMYNTLEERLRNSPEYKKSRKRVGKALKKLDDLGLSEEQMDVIDDVLTVCNENAAIYGRKAYIQGFKDAIAMIYFRYCIGYCYIECCICQYSDMGKY